MEPVLQEPVNQCDEISFSTATEENLDDFKSSQEYVYKFDDPLVKEYGSVKIDNNRLIIQLPVKPDHTNIFKPMHHVQLYLNSQLVFHSNWLPILTTHDHVKFKSMFQQIWQEYTILTQYKYQPSNSFSPLMHSEHITHFNTPGYHLACIENNYTTYMELKTKESYSPAPPQSDPVHVQLYVGSHLILCSKTQLQKLDTDSLQFVLSFILQKLMN